MAKAPCQTARIFAERLGGVVMSAERRQGIRELIAAAETELCRREPLMKERGGGRDER